MRFKWKTRPISKFVKSLQVICHLVSAKVLNPFLCLRPGFFSLSVNTNYSSSFEAVRYWIAKVSLSPSGGNKTNLGNIQAKKKYFVILSTLVSFLLYYCHWAELNKLNFGKMNKNTALFLTLVALNSGTVQTGPARQTLDSLFECMAEQPSRFLTDSTVAKLLEHPGQ